MSRNDLFNPFLPGWPYDVGPAGFMYEFLFYTIHPNGTIVPWLGEKWEWADTGYKQFRIYLRKGAYWSDGRPFTADDVKYTYDILLQYGAALSGGATAQQTIQEVIKEDNYTVLIKLKQPTPRFWQTITTQVIGAQYIVPKHLWEGKDPTTFKFSNPIGTGPYTLYRNEMETQIWKKDPNWWGIKVMNYTPVPDWIVFKYYATTDAMTMALTKGELDTFRGMTAATYNTLKPIFPNMTVWNPKGPILFIAPPCPLVLYAQCQKYPWDNPLVRKAIGCFINRDKAREAAQPGGGSLPVPYIWVPFPGLMKYVFSDIVTKYGNMVEYNVTKGHEILKSLGWKRGADGVYVTENGTRMENLVLGGGTVGGMFPIISQNIQTDLSDNGIVTVIKGIVASAPSVTFTAAGQWDLFVAIECGSYSDPIQTYEHFAAWYIINWTKYKETGQIVCIALAIALGPTLLVADEPTTALDVVVQKGVLQTLANIREMFKTSIILISHNIAVQAEMADRLAVMYAGKIVEVGGIQDLFENPIHPYTKGLMASVPSIEHKRISGIPGMPPDLRNPPPGCRFHPRCPVASKKCNLEEPKLYEAEPGHFVACNLNTLSG